MTLAEKIRYLREVEGSLRGLDRPMTQHELLKAIKAETGGSISQSYLSQIEGGKRPHMTQSTRTLLARFFKVHPGFLVDDPEGYQAFRGRPRSERRLDQAGSRERHAQLCVAAG